ncbi:MAG: FAD-dependent oxidoreductase [Lawsonibacter sp.]
MGHDIIVLGSGPAGMAAAVAARGRNKSALVIGNRWEDSPLAKAERVDNYLGMPAHTGADMLKEFYGHAMAMGVEFVAGRAISLMAWNGYMVTVGSEVYEGRALILAPGVQRQAKYPGEAEFLGRGVSYCATCDGMLYRNKPVTVVGRSSEAPQEANYLKSLGCQVVYVATKAPEGLDNDIPFVRASKLVVKGEQAMTALEADGTDLPCAGIFILRQAIAPTDLLPALETENGVVKVDRRMATNLEGVFAAGDCTGGPLQVSKAVGEGHVAALSACEYLDHWDQHNEQQKKGSKQV